MSELLTWLKETYKKDPIYAQRKRLICRDGFSMSVQGNSSYLYCTPRADVPEWKELEIGYPSQKEELLMDYVEDSNKPTDTVYGYVPIEIVEQVVQKHGGIADKDWRCQYCNSINPKDIYSCSKCGAGLE